MSPWAQLLLLFAVKLPELLSYVKIEEETLIRLQQRLLDFLKYLAVTSPSNCFSLLKIEFFSNTFIWIFSSVMAKLRSFIADFCRKIRAHFLFLLTKLLKLLMELARGKTVKRPTICSFKCRLVCLLIHLQEQPIYWCNMLLLFFCFLCTYYSPGTQHMVKKAAWRKSQSLFPCNNS